MRIIIAFSMLAVAVTAIPAVQPKADTKPGLNRELEELVEVARGTNEKAAENATEQLVAYGPAAVPALTQALWLDSTIARRSSARILGMIGPDARGAVPSLARLLRDDNRELRRDAARALGQIGSLSAIPALTRSLKDEAVMVRLAAVESLMELEVEADAVLPVLTEALKTKQPAELYYALKLLGDLGPEAATAVPSIQNVLAMADPESTAFIAEALGRIGPESKNAILVLKEKVKDSPDAQIFRVPAAIAIWRVSRDADAATWLRESLNAKKNPRMLPHFALWRLDRNQETINAFQQLLKSDDNMNVALAAAMLGNRAKESVEHFTALLKDPVKADQWVTALSVLGRSGPEAKQALPDLKAMAARRDLLASIVVYQIEPKPENALAIAEYLEDKEKRLQAVKALQALRPKGQAVAIELLAALDSNDDDFRLEAAIALWRINKDNLALKAVVKSLHGSDAKVRAQAAHALASEFGLEAKPAVEDLVKRLFDSHNAVRVASAEALGKIGAAAVDAIPPLLTILDGDEPVVFQAAACEALGYIALFDKETAIAALKQKLEHSSPRVRITAALALARLGDKSGAQEASEALKHRNYLVRLTAAETLWRLNKDARVVPLLIRTLQDSNLTGIEGDDERKLAILLLSRIGADAKDAATELAKLTDDGNEELAEAAAKAVKAIAPDGGKKEPKK